MLVLDLQPGVSMGQFSLGSLVNGVLKLARAEQQAYGCVEVKYDPEVIPRHDLVLNFSEHGFHLCFDSTTQSMRMIEVHDFSRVQVRQGMVVVGGSAHPATFDALYDLAGATYPGQVDEGNASYVMHWPGLLAVFPWSAHDTGSWQDLQQGRAVPGAQGIGAAPTATRLCIFAGSAVSLSELRQVTPPAPARHAHAPQGHLQMPLHLNVGIGITLGSSQQQLCFGATPQDAWSVLGAPSSTFSKQAPTRTPTRPGSPQALHSRLPDLVTDYFYNYFDRGLDLLFDGETHRLKKMVLHSNAPEHASFGMYNKCHFTLPVERDTAHLLQRPASLASSPGKAAPQAAGGGYSSSPHFHQHLQDVRQTQEHTAADSSHGWHHAEDSGDGMPTQQEAGLPMHDWLAGAEKAQIAFPTAAPPPSVPPSPSVQKALLEDIMAMARADSAHSDSSSISNQTRAHMQPFDHHINDQQKLQSWEPSSSGPPLPWAIDNGQHPHLQDSMHGRSHAEDKLGRASAGYPTRAPEGGRGGSIADDADGSAYAGWQGYPDLTNSLARESQLNGWDDMDPMAALSKSVQMPHEATQEQLPNQEMQQASGTVSASASATAAAAAAAAAAADHGRNGSASGSSNDVKQALHSYPVSIQPSSVATLSPLQPSLAQLNQEEDSFPLRAGISLAGHASVTGNGPADAFVSAALDEEKGQSDIASVAHGTGSNHGRQAPDSLTADSPWAEYERCLGAGSQAIMHSRGAGAPFGSTRVYGYPGIVFETTQGGRLATATLFKHQGNS